MAIVPEMSDQPSDDAPRNSPDAAPGHVSAFLYDADGEDRLVSLDQSLIESLDDQDLLWMDFNMSDEDALTTLDGLVGTQLAGFATSRIQPRPALRDYGEYFVLRVLPMCGRDEAQTLTCAMGHNWLATAHEGSVTALDEFASHLRGDSSAGRLDAPAFLARLLEWVINAYFDELDELQRAVDRLEVAILRELDEEEILEQLVGLRHDVGRLRRRLSPHRQLFATLAHPSFDVLSNSSAARAFEILENRLELAVESVDTTREMVVGAFDVFMTQTAQHTNDVMRVLTIVSLLLLPASLIAGLMGMNMVPEYLLRPFVFWLAVVLMILVSGGLLFIMRRRGWL